MLAYESSQNPNPSRSFKPCFVSSQRPEQHRHVVTASASLLQVQVSDQNKAQQRNLKQKTSLVKGSLSSYRRKVLSCVNHICRSSLSSMDKENNINQVAGAALNGFSLVSSTGIFWKSRKRAAGGRDLDKVTNNTAYEILNQQEETAKDDEKMQEAISVPELSERRKALFEPLEPITIVKGQQPPAESLLPPPDFDAASYPKGWLVGKKRKLVNVDVVESMRRIAIQEMNRKDREIDGLNEQLEEDSRCLEHLQVQLLEERSKRAKVERDNAMLQEQITMLMNMLQENEAIADEDVEDEGHDEP